MLLTPLEPAMPWLTPTQLLQLIPRYTEEARPSWEWSSWRAEWHVVARCLERLDEGHAAEVVAAAQVALARPATRTETGPSGETSTSPVFYLDELIWLAALARVGPEGHALIPALWARNQRAGCHSQSRYAATPLLRMALAPFSIEQREAMLLLHNIHHFGSLDMAPTPTLLGIMTRALGYTPPNHEDATERLETVVAQGEKVIAPLLEQLDLLSPSACGLPLIAEALGGLDTASTRAALRELTTHDAPEVRGAALSAWGSIGGEPERLAVGLSDPARPAWRGALDGLRRSPDREALRAALERPSINNWLAGAALTGRWRRGPSPSCRESPP